MDTNPHITEAWAWIDASRIWAERILEHPELAETAAWQIRFLLLRAELALISD